MATTEESVRSDGLADRLRFAAERVQTAREELALAIRSRDEVLVEAHDSQGVTVYQLAKLTGISRATITGILSNN